MKPKITWALIAFLAACSPAQTQVTSLTADGGFAATPIADCQTDLRYLNHMTGWQTTWPSQLTNVLQADEAGLTAALQTWTSVTDALTQAATRLQTGIDNHQTAPKAVVIRVQEQIQSLNAALKARSPVYFFVDPISPQQRQWNDRLSQQISPAIEVFAQFLMQTYAPAATLNPGLSSIPNGAECYQKAVLWWTSLDLAPSEISDIGTRYLAQTSQDLQIAMGQSVQSPEMLNQLRTNQANDRTSSPQIIAISEKAIARAGQSMNNWFQLPVDTNITVEPLLQSLQASSPAGFYQPGTNGSAAIYNINPSRPGDRRLMAEAIAFHEGIPGHHLFFTYPKDVPNSSFDAGLIEGWAIYSEYLADEIGLYSSQLDRQGMMAKHLWAASRLVIEPGLHLDNWSRDDAIAFMLENTVLSQAEVEVEIDRYLALPGQSLSYILGADTILRARSRAREQLGEQFDISEFHHTILAPGSRSLPQVERDVDQWIARKINQD